MSQSEILAAARAFGANGDASGFAAFAETHRCVVQNIHAKRNVGKVPAMDLMRAYAEGARERITA